MYDEDLANLEDWLRRLKVEYDIYFNGHRKRPPEDLRGRVDRIVKKLSEATNMPYSQRFRYNTLVARFCIFKDLWRRTLLERELGGSAKEALVSGERTAPKDGEATESTIRVSIENPATEEEKVRRLYETLLWMRGKHAKDPAAISYPQFARYIATQTQGLQGRYGCSRVVFTMSLEEHAIKFTARAET